mmetsp:Transcript_17828/g.39087  ORF Transcript_17828/g.39087 Transcript_17828/m.39087 type:complete len:235 (-) Transcript_17828:104-808(-)
MRRANPALRSSGGRGSGKARGPGPSETAPGGLGLGQAETTAPLGPLEDLERQVAALRSRAEQELADVATMKDLLQEVTSRNQCDEHLRRLERRIQVIENKDVETVHWRIEDAEEVRSKHKKGQYIASPEFAALGIGGLKFHFYPRGDDFAEEGYCSLYLHVPEDTRIERILFAGRSRHGPVAADSLRNCGVSELCVLSNEIDKATGSIVVGADALRVLSSPDVVETRTRIELRS